LIEIENKNISKYNKILDIYHKTSYYKRKSEEKKIYDKISISTPMCTHGHYGNLNNNKVFEFISDQKKKAYEEINKIVSQKEFDYLLDNSQKFKNKIKEDDIKYMKFIFDELKQYCDDIEKKQQISCK